MRKLCWRCERPTCRAEQLGHTAMLLGFPESMRMRVTTEQDECSYYHRQREHRASLAPKGSERA